MGRKKSTLDVPTIRLLTAQSTAVLDILQDGLMYRPKQYKSRTKQDYFPDLQQFKSHPVWCFDPGESALESFYDGTCLEELRCEMGLPRKNTWDGLFLLELDYPLCDVRRSQAFNSSPSTVVVPNIIPAYMVAAYELTDAVLPEEIDGVIPDGYFKQLVPKYITAKSTFKVATNFAEKYLEIYVP